MQRVVISSVILCHAFSLAGSAVGQDYQSGDPVVVVKGAKLWTDENPAVDEVVPGMVLNVAGSKDQWLWVVGGEPGWLDRAHVVPLNAAAIERLTAIIQTNPRDARLFSGRADVWRALGQIDKAIGDYNEAIRLDASPGNYNVRGLAWVEMEDYDKAIADFNEVLKLEPTNTDALFNRGDAWSAKRMFDKALADYAEVLRLDPEDPDAYNGRAWLCATCPDSRFRDGKQAIADATKACELTEWSDAGIIDTLAAAYSESGDFAKAVEWQTKAVSMVSASEKAEYQEHLELYRAGKPYRDESP